MKARSKQVKIRLQTDLLLFKYLPLLLRPIYFILLSSALCFFLWLLVYVEFFFLFAILLQWSGRKSSKESEREEKILCFLIDEVEMK